MGISKGMGLLDLFVPMIPYIHFRTKSRTHTYTKRHTHPPIGRPTQSQASTTNTEDNYNLYSYIGAPVQHRQRTPPSSSLSLSAAAPHTHSYPICTCAHIEYIEFPPEIISPNARRHIIKTGNCLLSALTLLMPMPLWSTNVDVDVVVVFAVRCIFVCHCNVISLSSFLMTACWLFWGLLGPPVWVRVAFMCPLVSCARICFVRVSDLCA